MPERTLPYSSSIISRKRTKNLSFFNYFQSELRKGYLLENDEERYAARREKVYTFLKIPREVEKFLAYGFFQSTDAFLFVFTFLPIRFVLAILSLMTRPLKILLGFKKNIVRLLKPAEIVDILKGTLLIICCYAISYIDTSVFYHIIKTQSTIKLYLFFNMLDIADRLMSAFGQDTLDALFWTATEPRDRKREHFGVLFHFVVACIYVSLHSLIVLLQALTLNVAINSDSKGLLTIVISNNFIELKGAVFKKFDRNNLLQISCSDVRERFHICFLLCVVVMQTMKEYDWKGERLLILMPDCILVLGTEVMIDWIKHAFITRFNDIPIDAYRDYTLLIASDLVMCKQKFAYSDHSDLVARRMGFIPLPLGVVIYRILSTSLDMGSSRAYFLLFLGYLCLLTFRVLNGIVMLGKASQLINTAEIRSRNASECAELKSIRRVATSNCSTPLRERRRNKSKENESLQTKVVVENLSHTHVVETVAANSNLDKNNMPVQKRVTNEDNCSSETTLSYQEREERSDDFNDEGEFSESRDSDQNNLSFLGDSRNGLLANSMVDLNKVGINRGVADQNSGSTITQVVSPDVPTDVDNKCVFIYKTVSQENINSDSFDTPSDQSSFSSTKSCPNFTNDSNSQIEFTDTLSERSQSTDSTYVNETTSQTSSNLNSTLKSTEQSSHDLDAQISITKSSEPNI